MRNVRMGGTCAMHAWGVAHAMCVWGVHAQCAWGVHTQCAFGGAHTMCAWGCNACMGGAHAM